MMRTIRFEMEQGTEPYLYFGFHRLGNWGGYGNLQVKAWSKDTPADVSEIVILGTSFLFTENDGYDTVFFNRTLRGFDGEFSTASTLRSQNGRDSLTSIYADEDYRPFENGTFPPASQTGTLVFEVRYDPWCYDMVSVETNVAPPEKVEDSPSKVVIDLPNLPPVKEEPYPGPHPSDPEVPDPVFEKPTVSPVQISIPYNDLVTVKTMDMMEPNGAGSWDYSEPLKLRVQGSSQDYSTTLDLDGVVIDVNNLTISITKEAEFYGPLPRVEMLFTNDKGLSASTTLDVLVLDPPAVPVEPIKPVISASWNLGSWATGLLSRYDLPFTGDSIKIDVAGDDEADILIPLYALTDEERANFRSLFRINNSMLACVSDEGDVLFAGYIEKLSPSFEDEMLKIKAKSMKAWLKKRFVIEGDRTTVNSTDEIWTMKAHPETIVKNILTSVFVDERSPQTIDYPVSKPGDYRVDYKVAELPSVSDAIDDIIGDPLGVEIQFRPKIVNGAVRFDLISGAPHINFPSPVDEDDLVIDLEDENSIVSSFEQVDDGVDAFNKLWLESRFEGQEGKAINLQARVAVSDEPDLIMEAKENFGSMMSKFQIQEQFEARLEDANKTSRQNTISVWDEELTFVSALGRRLKIVGSGRSAGLDDTVRILAVTFSTAERSVQITLSNIKRSYPPVPKDIMDKIKEENEKSSRNDWADRETSFDGFEFDPTEGMLPEDEWGDEGMEGEGTSPQVIENGVIRNWYDSLMVMDFVGSGMSMVQNNRNIVFGLNRAEYNVQINLYDPDTNDQIYGELNNNLLPVGGLNDFSIYKTTLSDGTISPLEVSGFIPPLQMARLTSGIPSQAEGMKLSFLQGKFSIFWLDGRIYLTSLMRGKVEEVLTEAEREDFDGIVETKEFYSNNMVSVSVSDNGDIGGDWRDEEPLPKKYFFTPASTTRVGDKLIIGTFTAPIQGPYGNEYETVPGNYIFTPNMSTKWRTYTPADFQSSENSPAILTSYSGWLFSMRTKETSEIYRTKLTSDGLVPSDPAWVAFGNEYGQFDGSFANMAGITFVRGNIIYPVSGRELDFDNSGDGVHFQPERMGYSAVSTEGILATENTAQDPFTTIFATDFDYGDGKQYGPDGSRLFSYGGFAYRLIVQPNDSAVRVRSFRITRKPKE